MYSNFEKLILPINECHVTLKYDLDTCDMIEISACFHSILKKLGAFFVLNQTAKISVLYASNVTILKS